MSIISHRQCMRPRESVDPMYMPGLFRTASSPSSTERCLAEYASPEFATEVHVLLLRHHAFDLGRTAGQRQATLERRPDAENRAPPTPGRPHARLSRARNRRC
ncbi:hypothetical protein ACFPRL_00775 [Pseudoclavibacter helvolus]